MGNVIVPPWTDLIKGIQLEGDIQQQDDGSVVITNGSISGSAIGLTASDNPTVEICCKLGVNSSITFSSKNSESSFLMRVSNDSVKFCSGNKAIYAVRDSYACSFSANSERISSDENTLEIINDTTEQIENGTIISVTGSVKIYAIRVYSIIKDSLKNAKKDIARFDARAFGGYIRDGLILQLDCRHYEVGSKVWTPDIADLDIGMNNTQYTFAKDEDGGIIFDGTKHFKTDNVPIDYVIEVCFKADDIKSECFLLNAQYDGWGYQYSGVALCKYNGGIRYIDNMSTPSAVPIGINDEITTLTSLIGASVYKNGERVDFYSSGVTISAANDWAIGKGLIGKMYSIRIYEASKYSEKVAAHNYAMDKKNFDHSVPSNAVLLNGGEPIQLLGGDYVELNKN